MRQKEPISIRLIHILGYIVFTVLLYSIFYYTRSYSWGSSTQQLRIVTLLWPCCVIAGLLLCLTKGMWQKNRVIAYGMLLCTLMGIYILLNIGVARSARETLTEFIYCFLWISLVCVFFYLSRDGLLRGIAVETLVFLPIITVVFVQLVFSNQTVESVKTLNPIFYILYLTPFVALFKKPLYSCIGFAIIFASVVLSNKRTALIVLAIIVVYYYTSRRSAEKKTLAQMLKRIAGAALFIVAVVLIYKYSAAHFKIDWLQRLESISETGGSGRIERWEKFFTDINESSLLECIFGHGVVYPYYHNDFMQIYYDVGLLGLSLYIGVWVKLIQLYFKMRKSNYRYMTAYGISLIIFFVNSFVGQVIVVHYWILEMAVFWGLIFGDYYYTSSNSMGESIQNGADKNSGFCV